MRYTIEGFGQEYALTLTKTIIENEKEKTIKIDCIDLIILRWFVDFYPNMAKVEIEGVQYAWINYKSLLDDMPLLDMGKHMLANRLQKLCEFGILTHKTIKHGGSFSYYGFGSNYRNLIERPSAIDAQGMQKNADGMQNIADPCTINCTTPIQFIADPYAKNCITNNSSTKDPSSKDSSSKDRDKATSRFIPPTAREVHDYCQEKGYHIDIEHFISYYQSNGWKVGKNKMKDWKAAVVTWVRNDKKYGNIESKPKEEPKVYAHPFDDGSDPEYTRRALEAQKRRGW